jgi:hypothetical protein
MNHLQSTVLGVHPSAYGFGWALFEGPRALLDWGTADVRGNKNAKALVRIDKILDEGKPRILALEEFDGVPSRRHDRVRRLYRAIIKRAAARRIVVRIFSRSQIEETFARAKTREQIAAVIADRIEAVRGKLPPPRKIWVSENPNMALFSAVACVLTYYARLTDRS